MPVNPGDRVIVFIRPDGTRILYKSHQLLTGRRVATIPIGQTQHAGVTSDSLLTGDRVVIHPKDGTWLGLINKPEIPQDCVSGACTLTEQFVIPIFTDANTWMADSYNGLFGNENAVFTIRSHSAFQQYGTPPRGNLIKINPANNSTDPSQLAVDWVYYDPSGGPYAGISSFDCRGGFYDGSTIKYVTFDMAGTANYTFKSMCLVDGTYSAGLCQGCTATSALQYCEINTTTPQFTNVGGDGAGNFVWGYTPTGGLPDAFLKMDKNYNILTGDVINLCSGHTMGANKGIAGGNSFLYLYEAGGDGGLGRIWKYDANFDVVDVKYIEQPAGFTGGWIPQDPCRSNSYNGSPYFGGTESCIWMGIPEYLYQDIGGGYYLDLLHVYKMVPF